MSGITRPVATWVRRRRLAAKRSTFGATWLQEQIVTKTRLAAFARRTAISWQYWRGGQEELAIYRGTCSGCARPGPSVNSLTHQSPWHAILSLGRCWVNRPCRRADRVERGEKPSACPGPSFDENEGGNALWSWSRIPRRAGTETRRGAATAGGNLGSPASHLKLANTYPAGIRYDRRECAATLRC